MLLLMCLPLLAPAQETATEILNKMLETLRQQESFSYEAHYQLNAHTPGAQKVSGLVHLYRDDTEPVLGGMAWLSEGVKYETYSFYNRQHRYVVLKAIRKVWKERMPAGGAMGLSSLADNLLEVPFLKLNQWKEQWNKLSWSRQADTTISGTPCYTLTGSHADVRENWYISRSGFVPVLHTTTQQRDGQTQHTSLLLRNHQLGKTDMETFNPATAIPEGYTIESRDREVPKGVQPEVRSRDQWPLPGNRGR